jgi:hypothetical protein
MKLLKNNHMTLEYLVEMFILHVLIRKLLHKIYIKKQCPIG